MPIKEEDPWRMQYFEGVACPDDVLIPTEDADSYVLFPQYRWVYNKLEICESQGIACGPHGLHPQSYPLFSKPIYNMRGMGAGSRILHSESEYKRHQRPGHMWSEMLTGEHVSSDVAVVDGEPVWWRHVLGEALDGGMFDYWTILAEHRPAIEDYCGAWLREHFKDYTGMVNFETIGGRIIETHLRFSDQWPDLYGDGWVESLVALYTERTWGFADTNRRTGYSVVLFGGHGLRYQHPDAGLVGEILADTDVSSVQITFHADWSPTAHSMPPGGFRLAIINCWDLHAGFEARDRLALSFWSTQQLYGRRRRAVGERAASRSRAPRNVPSQAD